MLNTPCHNKLRIAGTASDSIVDGPGIRYVIFTQGCPHHCPGCHNPETHSFINKQLYKAEDLLMLLMENPILDGVTFSGGDPFFQAEANIELIDLIKTETNLDIWAYTGYSWEDFINFKLKGEQPKHKAPINHKMIEMLEKCDVVVDGRYIESLRTLDSTYVGSSNQRVIDVKKSINLLVPVIYLN